MPTLIPIFVLTEGLWFYIISSERGNDDAGFKLVEPIIVALFYGFYAFPTAWMIMCDYEKAILYYDQTEKDAYKIYQAEQQAIAAAAAAEAATTTGTDSITVASLYVDF